MIRCPQPALAALVCANFSGSFFVSELICGRFAKEVGMRLRRSRMRDGFTLIELLVVIAIIAL